MREMLDAFPKKKDGYPKIIISEIIDAERPWLQFQTPASQKQKIFFGFFIEFLKCAWNLEHFR